jgi:hypothetical protein
MVLFFECCDPKYTVFMGKDKYENEVLLKFGFQEDIWFHVDDLSSAHVYLRRPTGEKIEDVNPEVIAEMCQLVKNNSIEGSKASRVDIIYTEFLNVKKTASMDTGSVSFHNQNAVIKVKHVERDREITNRIEKTRKERFPDLEKMKADRDLEEKNRRKKELKEQQEREKAEKKFNQEQEELRSYKTFLKPTDLKTSNKAQGDGTIESCKKIEDDFW